MTENGADTERTNNTLNYIKTLDAIWANNKANFFHYGQRNTNSMIWGAYVEDCVLLATCIQGIYQT